MNYKGEVPEIRGFSKFEFPAHASGADETLVSFGIRSNRRRVDRPRTWMIDHLWRDLAPTEAIESGVAVRRAILQTIWPGTLLKLESVMKAVLEKWSGFCFRSRSVQLRSCGTTRLHDDCPKLVLHSCV
jgi:hypothetical protein